MSHSLMWKISHHPWPAIHGWPWALGVWDGHEVYGLAAPWTDAGSIHGLSGSLTHTMLLRLFSWGVLAERSEHKVMVLETAH